VTVFVLFAEYGADENCGPPEAVVLTEKEALDWIAKNPECNTYSEFKIEDHQ
jgi:hypothetical protein